MVSFFLASRASTPRIAQSWQILLMSCCMHRRKALPVDIARAAHDLTDDNPLFAHFFHPENTTSSLPQQGEAHTGELGVQDALVHLNQVHAQETVSSGMRYGKKKTVSLSQYMAARQVRMHVGDAEILHSERPRIPSPWTSVCPQTFYRRKAYTPPLLSLSQF